MKSDNHLMIKLTIDKLFNDYYYYNDNENDDFYTKHLTIYIYNNKRNK